MTKEILAGKVCSVENCSTKTLALGLCNLHYRRFRRHGDPTLGGTKEGAPIAWLKAHIEHSDDECLIWPFALDKRGCARIRHNSRNIAAARVMCELAHGEPAPEQTDCAHNCGKGHLGCVNPKHLRWATHRENALDTKGHGTLPRGERHGIAKLTEAQVREIRHLWRTTPKITKSQLGLKYNVHRVTIAQVVIGRYWGWLPD